MSNISFTLTPATREYIKTLSGLSKTKLYRKIDVLFDRQGSLMAGRISKNYLRGQRLNSNSGTLAKSIIGRAVRVASTPAVRVGVFKGPALAYAGAQEFGTRGKNPNSPYNTIVPKKAKALAMPTDDGRVKFGSGISRYTSPRDFPGELAFVPFSSTGLAIGGLYAKEDIKSGKSLQELSALWILLRELDLEPKYYLRDGFSEYLPQLERELLDLLEDEIS